MCDLADEVCPIWEVHQRRARKEHRCMSCPEPIRAGVLYRVTEFLFDGHWTRWKHCERCHRIFRAIQDSSFDVLAIDPGLDCGQIWKDPPEAVASLAFALPGDFEKEARK